MALRSKKLPLVKKHPMETRLQKKRRVGKTQFDNLPEELKRHVRLLSRTGPVLSAVQAAGARSLHKHRRQYKELVEKHDNVFEKHPAYHYSLRFGHTGYLPTSLSMNEARRGKLYSLSMNGFSNMHFKPYYSNSTTPHYRVNVNKHGHVYIINNNGSHKPTNTLPPFIRNNLENDIVTKVYKRILGADAALIQKRVRDYLARKRKN